MLFRTSSKLFNVSRFYGLSYFYSTEAMVSSSFIELEAQILSNGDPKNPMTPILNQWVQQGRDVTDNELRKLVNRLSISRRFTHALQISEWMSNERNYSLTSGDIAKRINLLSRVHGVEQAESFFRAIPDAELGFNIYAALLKCYAEHKSLGEAEAVMKKIREYHPTHMTGCYNFMMKLYAQLRKYEKLDSLMQEMREKDACNGLTFIIRLNAYVVAADIEGMEKFLMTMEADPLATVDWYAYLTAARGYLKSGNSEKALAMLKKSEKLARGKRVRIANESIQTMYAAIGKKDEVYRIWNRWKSLKRCQNSSYISMLSSLLKLGDIAGAEKILGEWESESKNFDPRVPNMMISAYCRSGMLDKAETYIKRLLDSGKPLNGTSWDRLANGYCMDNDMEKAVETMKKAMEAMVDLPMHRLNPFTFAACLEYLKGKDLELALDFLQSCREADLISVGTYDKLASYVHGKIQDTKALDLIRTDYRLELDDDVQLDNVERTDQ